MIDQVYRKGLPFLGICILICWHTTKPSLSYYVILYVLILPNFILQIIYFILFPFYKWSIQVCDSNHNSFLDPSQYPASIQAIENSWVDIRREFINHINDKTKQSLIQPIDSVSKSSFGGLAKATGHKWHSIMFYSYGKKHETGLHAFHTIRKLIDTYPDINLMMLSILEPNSHIPPHNGPFRGVWRLHVPLLVPDKRESCFITVEGIQHSWREGQAVVLDDTFRHSVTNSTPDPRVLIFADIERFSILQTNWFGRLLSRINHWIIHSSGIPLWFFEFNRKNEITQVDQTQDYSMSNHATPPPASISNQIQQKLTARGLVM
jgi:ornithine lipid ester-linked acyl 2-hydroxylase